MIGPMKTEEKKYNIVISSFRHKRTHMAWRKKTDFTCNFIASISIRNYCLNAVHKSTAIIASYETSCVCYIEANRKLLVWFVWIFAFFRWLLYASQCTPHDRYIHQIHYVYKQQTHSHESRTECEHYVRERWVRESALTPYKLAKKNKHLRRRRRRRKNIWIKCQNPFPFKFVVT